MNHDLTQKPERGLAEREKKRPAPLRGKDELNLTEYPFVLVSERVPPNVDSIEYKDWVTVDGEKRPLSWVVTGSAEHGLPRGADQDVFVALMHIWALDGFQSIRIPVGSAYRLLEELGWDDSAKSYRRLRAALDRFFGLRITSENAIYDRQGKARLTRRGITLIQGYYLIDPVPSRRGSGDAEPFPVGHVEASEFLYQSVLNGNLKDIDLALFRKLPTQLSKHLYRYLDKQRYYGSRFRIDQRKLALKLGLSRSALETYGPAKLKQLLEPALNALVAEGFLRAFAFSPARRPGKHNLVVEFSESRPAKSSTRFRSFVDGTSGLVETILAVTGDDRSRPFYEKVVRELALSEVEALVRETEEAKAAGRIKTTPARFFTDRASRALKIADQAA